MKSSFDLLDSIYEDYNDDPCDILQILKYTVQFLSSLVCLFGVLALLTGLWFYFDFYPVPIDTLTTGLIYFNLFGVFCILIGSYGCYVTNFSYRFILIILIIIFVGVLAALAAISYFTWIDVPVFYRDIDRFMDDSFKKRIQDKNASQLQWFWYYLQVNNKCCAVNSSMDYKNNNGTTSLACCQEIPVDAKDNFLYQGVYENESKVDEYVVKDLEASTESMMYRPYQMRYVFDCKGLETNKTTTYVKGCMVKMKDSFEDNAFRLIGLAVVISAIMLLTTILLCMGYCYHHIVPSSEHY